MKGEFTGLCFVLHLISNVRGGSGNLNSLLSGFSAQWGHDMPNVEEKKDEQTTTPPET